MAGRRFLNSGQKISAGRKMFRDLVGSWKCTDQEISLNGNDLGWFQPRRTRRKSKKRPKMRSRLRRSLRPPSDSGDEVTRTLFRHICSQLMQCRRYASYMSDSFPAKWLRTFFGEILLPKIYRRADCSIAVTLFNISFELFNNSFQIFDNSFQIFNNSFKLSNNSF